jgi:hypothetical protein
VGGRGLFRNDYNMEYRFRTPERFAPETKAGQDVFKHAGQMTYPLYLTHSVVGAFLIRVMVGAGVNAWAALAIAIGTMLCVAYIVARYGEPDLRKVLRGAWERAEAASRTPMLWRFCSSPAVASPKSPRPASLITARKQRAPAMAANRGT